MNNPADINTVATVPLWIDGRAQPATSTRSAGVTNPATGKVTRQVPLANAQDIDTAMEKLAEELAADERVREEIASRVDAALLSEYRQRYASLNGKVVVEARGEACSGCFMSIPPQIFVNVKKNESIISCPHCHRILYYKEAITPKTP